jgi:Holliday junction resolvase RusA-like endonuclease
MLDDILKHGNDEIKLEASNLQLADVYHLEVCFYVGANDSDSNSKKQAKFSNLVPANKKPDMSNLLKFYEDALNKIFIKDDAMITRCFMSKRYSDQPRVEIDIQGLLLEGA